MWNLYVWLHGERLLDTFTNLDVAEQVREELYKTQGRDITVRIRPVEITNSIERSMKKYASMAGSWK